jgi:F-type H+-transporting ATPase subunit gamma
VATLRDIRRRIKSVQNTRKITRAMEMVAGAKLKQLEAQATRSRPFTEGLAGVLKRLVKEHPDQRHPLFEARGEEKRVALLLITSDTGLCGSYNADLVREAEGFLNKRDASQVELITVGAHCSSYFLQRGIRPYETFVDLKAQVSSKVVQKIIESTTELYISGEVDAVYILSCYYHSAAKWGIQTRRFLSFDVERDSGFGPLPISSILEPGADQVFDAVIPRYLRGQLGQILSEAFSAEQLSRMMAMRSATDNANEMINDLTLLRNKLRQAQITNEIIEVVTGAEGLKA